MTRSGAPIRVALEAADLGRGDGGAEERVLPAPSMMRPQRGSRAMSTIGAKAQWMPTARASRAATAWPRSIVAGSQEAAIAIGTGRIVRSPWITSKPNSAGMPSRWPSTASRWRRLTSAGSVTKSSEPDLAPPEGRLDRRRVGWVRHVVAGPVVRLRWKPK